MSMYNLNSYGNTTKIYVVVVVICGYLLATPTAADTPFRSHLEILLVTALILLLHG